MRAWKPGDVAMLDVESAPNVALVVQFNPLGCPAGHNLYPLHAHLDDGDWSTVTELRPLVVMDPEDADHARRLADEFFWAARAERSGDHHRYGQMQDALRSLIAPPKPDEPLGLGSVVEVSDGRKFVRVDDPIYAWCGYDEKRCETGQWPWADIPGDPVRVLSEGVQP